MPSFVHTFPLVNKNVNVKCKEMTFHTYKNLTKTIYNEDEDGINTYADQTLKEVILNYPHNHLDIIDKIILLISLRNVDINPTLELQGHCEKTDKEYPIIIPIDELLTNLDNIKLQKEHKIEKNNMRVVFQLPTSFSSSSDAEVYCSAIKSIEVGSESQEVIIPDYVDKTAIFDKLPISFFNEFREVLSQQEAQLIKHTIFSHKSPHDDKAEEVQFKLSFIDKSCMLLLGLLFRENLQSLYEFEYDLYSFCNLPHDLVKNSTFSELQLMYNIELQRRKQQAGD